MDNLENEENMVDVEPCILCLRERGSILGVYCVECWKREVKKWKWE